MTSLRLSDFPLPVSPLFKKNGFSRRVHGKVGYSRQNDALILGRPSHVIVRIICKLKYVWGKGLLVCRYAAVLGGILVKNRVGVAGHILVGVDNDDRRAADTIINGVREESFSNTRDDGIV